MTRSKGFLTNHPDEFALWLFRAHFCLRDDKQTEGMEAAQNLKRLGGIENTNPTVHQEMIDLNLRNWLQPAAESQKLIPIPTPASATSLCAPQRSSYELLSAAIETLIRASTGALCRS
jgi:hypothetical protein